MKIQILILEHDPYDVAMIQRELKKGGINFIAVIVEVQKDYENALRNFEPDIILSDYTLPSFDGPTTFKIKEAMAPFTPFIFVSGTIGEEASIEHIVNGVTDFALKDRLFTLLTKVTRALKDAKGKREKHIAERALILSEDRLNKAQQIAHVGSWELDLVTNILLWSVEYLMI